MPNRRILYKRPIKEAFVGRLHVGNRSPKNVRGATGREEEGKRI